MATAKDATQASTTKKPDDVALARADVDAAECAVTFAAAELCSVKSRAEAMKATWAKADDQSENASLIEAERTSSNKAIAAQRQAELTKALFDSCRCETSSPDRAGGAESNDRSGANQGARIAEQAHEDCGQPRLRRTITTRRSLEPKLRPRGFSRQSVDDKTINWSDQSTGRRKALAEWITDARNPLTARVAVNHIWNRHMGTPLAPNVFDLGRNSPLPSNPELLDWLAAELIESGWDMKHLHRLIVTSATYRMSSETAGREAEVAKDPDNVYWWRRNTIRLESEVIRDSILSLAGTLDLTMGGPPVASAEQEDSRRRSIYFFHSNNERNLFLTTFDVALVTECYRRNQSVVPQQALAMTNSRLVLDSSKPIAERISKAISPNESEVDDDRIYSQRVHAAAGQFAERRRA